MPDLSIIFYHGRGGIYDRAIRLWTWSRFSHCEVALDGYALRADPQRGIFWHADPVDTDWDAITIHLGEAQFSDALRFAGGEVGCAYDWKGIFLSQVIGLRREDPTRWFCSELCAAVLQQTGIGAALLTRRACTYSPGQLFRVLAAVGRTIQGS